MASSNSTAHNATTLFYLNDWTNSKMLFHVKKTVLIFVNIWKYMYTKFVEH